MSTATLPSANADIFGDPQLHIDGDVLAMAFSPDGNLWSVEEPGVLRRWNATTGELLDWHLLSDMESLWCFSRDVRVLASASDDLTLWDPTSGNMLTALSQPSWVTAMAFSPDPSFLVTGHDDGFVRLWDVAGHQLVREFALHKKPVSAVAFNGDGTYIASACEDKRIALWNVADGTSLGELVGHTDRIPALAWHPDGNLLVSAGWDTTARVWDVTKQEPAILLNSHATQVHTLAFSNDGGKLACADSANRVHVWDFFNMTCLHVLDGPQADIRCLAFSADGKQLACNGQHVLHLWNADSGESLSKADAPHLTTTAIAVHPGGKQLAANSGGSPVRIWDIASKKANDLLSEQSVSALAYSPNGKLLLGAAGTHIRIWDAEGNVKADLDGPDDPITTLAVSPDSEFVAGASSTGLGAWIWRISDGKPVLLIPDALDGCAVEALAFHPNGKLLAVGGIDWLATGGSDGAICLWDINERAEITTFLGGTKSIAFDPTGEKLASTSLAPSVCVWDVEGKEIIAELTGHDDVVTSVAYSPDGAWLASASQDHTIRMWDEAGQERAVHELDTYAKAVAFSPDGKYLFTGNSNTTCYRLAVAEILSGNQ